MRLLRYQRSHLECAFAWPYGKISPTATQLNLKKNTSEYFCIFVLGISLQATQIVNPMVQFPPNLIFFCVFQSQVTD